MLVDLERQGKMADTRCSFRPLRCRAESAPCPRCRRCIVPVGMVYETFTFISMRPTTRIVLAFSSRPNVLKSTRVTSSTVDSSISASRNIADMQTPPIELVAHVAMISSELLITKSLTSGTASSSVRLGEQVAIDLSR